MTILHGEGAQLCRTVGKNVLQTLTVLHGQKSLLCQPYTISILTLIVSFSFVLRELRPANCSSLQKEALEL